MVHERKDVRNEVVHFVQSDNLKLAMCDRIASLQYELVDKGALRFKMRAIHRADAANFQYGVRSSMSFTSLHLA
jgi:hypothetical protein